MFISYLDISLGVIVLCVCVCVWYVMYVGLKGGGGDRDSSARRYFAPDFSPDFAMELEGRKCFI